MKHLGLSLNILIFKFYKQKLNSAFKEFLSVAIFLFGVLSFLFYIENIQPVDVVKSIVPTRNSLMFFEVSPGSYHQVSVPGPDEGVFVFVNLS